jgi:hypothetical protein
LSQPAQPKSNRKPKPTPKSNHINGALEEVVLSSHSKTTTNKQQNNNEMLQNVTERIQFAFPIGPRKNASKTTNPE